jgi:hypothetical protein
MVVGVIEAALLIKLRTGVNSYGYAAHPKRQWGRLRYASFHLCTRTALWSTAPRHEQDIQQQENSQGIHHHPPAIKALDFMVSVATEEGKKNYNNMIHIVLITLIGN